MQTEVAEENRSMARYIVSLSALAAVLVAGTAADAREAATFVRVDAASVTLTREDASPGTPFPSRQPARDSQKRSLSGRAWKPRSICVMRKRSAGWSLRSMAG